MATMPEYYIKQVQLGSNNHELVAKFIQDNSGNAMNWSDIEALMEVGFDLVALDSLPPADASAYQTYHNKIVLIPSSQTASQNVKDEYIIHRSDAEGSYTYAWEKIGSSEVDLSNYARLDHTHTLGSSKTKLSATAAGTDLNTSDAAFVTGFAGEHTNTSVVTGFNTPTSSAVVDSVTPTTQKLVTGTFNAAGAATSIPNVTGNANVTIPNVTGNADVTVPVVSSNTGVTASRVQVVDGQAASWGAQVNSGVLSFNWTANVPTAVTASDVTATNTVFGTDTTASKVTLGTALEASKVTLGTAISAATVGDAVTYATGEISAAGTGSDVVTGVSTTANVNAITAINPTTDTAIKTLSTFSTDDALTAASVKTQPTITIAAGATGDVEVVNAVDSSTSTAVQS